MSSDVVLLGVDLGTSGVRMGLFDRSGRLLAETSLAYRPEAPKPGWSQIAPDLLWESVCRCAKDLRAGHNDLLGRVVSVGTSTMYPVLVLLDEHDKPVCPAILYNDTRSTAEAEHLSRVVGVDRFVRLAGIRPSAGSTACTGLMWLGREDPALFARVATACTLTSYVGMRLTRRVVIDESSAGVMGVYDISGKRSVLNDRLLSASGLSQKSFPEVMPPAARLGTLSEDARQALGVPAGVVAAVGTGDTTATAVGLALFADGQMGLICGSTDNFVLAHAEGKFDPAVVNVRHAVDGLYIAIAVTNATGAPADWFVREFFGGDYDAAFRAASEASADEDAPLVLPYILGERVPLWNPDAKGVVFGIGPSHAAGDLFRSLLEGTALADRACLETVRAAAPADMGSLVVTGGGARNDFWARMRADCMGVTLRRSSRNDHTLLGAAVLGGLAAGVYADWSDVRKVVDFAGDEQEFAPDAGGHAYYSRRFERSNALYRAVEPLFIRKGISCR